jgi:hypothetical protein
MECSWNIRIIIVNPLSTTTVYWTSTIHLSILIKRIVHYLPILSNPYWCSLLISKTIYHIGYWIIPAIIQVYTFTYCIIKRTWIQNTIRINMIMIVSITINVSSTLVKSILSIHLIISSFRPHHWMEYIYLIIISSLS